MVTGGASFIGSTLVDHLTPVCEAVLVIDDFSSGKVENLNLEKIELLRVDISESFESVKSAIQKFKPHVLFHLAAVHGGRGFIETYPELMLKNLVIDQFIFNSAVLADCPMIVHASSACAYPVGLQSNEAVLNFLAESMAGFGECGLAFPDGVYGWVKLMGEFQLETIATKRNRGRSARIFTAYGERENESHAAIALIAKAILGADPFPIWGNGLQTRNFTHVQDTVRGLLLLGADPGQKAFDVFNIGSSTHTRVIDFVRVIFDELGFSPSQIDYQVDKPVGVASRASNNEKILQAFGWEPSISIADGVSRTIRWYRDKPDRPQTLAQLEDLLLSRG